MQKRIYWFLFLLSVVLILGGCGKKVDGNKVSPATKNNVAEDKKEPETIKMSTSAKEIMKSGKSLDCTFSFTDADQGAIQSGRFYVDGPKARFRSEMEITMNSTGQKIKSYMITDGDYGYSWNSIDAKTGFKINLNEPASTENIDKNSQKIEDLNQRIDFDCRNWPVDNSKFILPTGIEFRDLSAAMKSLSLPANAAACSICDQIPNAEIKAECQKASCKK